ncbi:hypothetical protein AVDCRST_MAG81-4104 [uncultured Synechococcales cyanobacterium]|uniref:MAPEG family protein n=1 Tax=uncultured Synechococcales cyanobacterium TaxID=1936017 RepID=A0A6J4VQK9_9CYAN|nr:hypothetical protein AVDCRST_MAG81-4104 [uncultured Synechococcales cyanobacterium]
MTHPGSAILLNCIAAAALLMYAPFVVVAYARLKVGYDNAAPRTMFDKLPPYAQRANWAYQNSMEAFMLFAAAALTAYVTGQDTTLAIGAALTFVVARLLYPIFYILNVPIARSLMFGVGSLCITTLFVLSLLAGNGDF